MITNEGYYTEKGSLDAEGWDQEGNSVIEERLSFTSSHVCRMKGQYCVFEGEHSGLRVQKVAV